MSAQNNQIEFQKNTILKYEDARSAKNPAKQQQQD